MDMNLIARFIRPELVILVVCIYCIGLFLKKVPGVKDWLIPLILLGCSLVLTVLYVDFVIGEGFTPASVVTSIIQGVIVAALAVFSNEIIKQITIKRHIYDDDGKPK